MILLVVCRMAVEKYPENPMLGRREIVDGKVFVYGFFFCIFIYRLIYRCIHLCVVLLCSAGEVCMANVPRSVRHCYKAGKLSPKLWS